MALVGAIFASLVLICSGIAFAADDETPDSSGQTEAPNSSPLDEPGVEIQEDRSATSQTFVLPDGRRETRLYETPVNYRDTQGDWQSIDESLHQTASGAIENGANSFDVRLPNRLGAGASRLSEGDQWVAARLLGGTTTAAEVDGATSTYQRGNEATFEVASVPTGLKETIELADASAPTSFHYELSASVGLEPRLEDDGSIAFRDLDDVVFASLPAPTVSDSAPGAALESDPVRYELEATQDGNWSLAVKVDDAWLQAPNRVWPARIDPSIESKASAVLDCQYFVKEPSGETNSTPTCGAMVGATELKAEYAKSGGVTSRYRSALTFDFHAIPANAWVESASVNLYDPETATGLGAVQLRAAWRNWDPFINWNTYRSPEGSTTFPWSTPGGDFYSKGSELSTAERGTAPGWWTFKGMAPLVTEWLHKEMGLQGLIVKLADESTCASNCSHGRFTFKSSASPKATRPYLAVQYWQPAPSTSKVTLPSDGTVTAKRVRLKAAWTGGGVTGVTYQYRDSKSNEFKTIPTELVRDGAGNAVSWPQPTSGHESSVLYFDAAHATPTLRKQGGSVKIRALFEAPTGEAGYSVPVEATVNRFLGAPKDATVQVGPGSVDLLTGNLTVKHTDVSIPTFKSGLEFSRVHSSRGLAEKGSPQEAAELTSVLGPGWKPSVSIEGAGESAWQSVKIVHESLPYEVENEEEEVEIKFYDFDYALVTMQNGSKVAFEKEGENYVTPPEVTGWSLTATSGGSQFVLADPSGTRTTFANSASTPQEYLPISIAQPGGPGNATRAVYQLIEGKKVLSMIIAPTPPGVSCNTEAEAKANYGCRALYFWYTAAASWGAPVGYGYRLGGIDYYAPRPGGGAAPTVAQYTYNKEGRLTAEWDPRISPALKETYAYTAGGQLQTITPPGLKPWEMEYGTTDEELANGRLMAVKRASLVESSPTAQTTISYGVPLSGEKAPYAMGGSSVAEWGQSDVPVDATAVFPADQIPASPPTSYSRATVYYMDSEGQLVNTATPPGAGTSAPSIATSESDEFGNVTRELTAQNRLRALAAGSGSVALSHELETKRFYSADGTEMQQERGPLHSVRLESGTSTQARFYRAVQYEDPTGAGAPTPNPHLPTRETTGALVGGSVKDPRETTFNYNWNLRALTETTTDPGEGGGHLNLKKMTTYDEATGLPVEIRQPSNPGGGGAGTARIVYYTGSAIGQEGCTSKPEYAGLPCKLMPAAQPGTAGQPELLVKWISSYSQYAAPTEKIEWPGSNTGTTRRTLTTYDNAGRTLTVKREGGGTMVPKSEILYSESTGLPTTQRFKCETSCTGFDDQAVTTTYDTLGRVSAYQDADGNTATTTYDLLGQPVTTSDGKGTQTRVYDPISGLLTELKDSAAGTFTASYNADGDIVEEGLPDGLVGKTTYDETGAATHLSYVKSTMCSVNCTWLDFNAEKSIFGQVLAQTSTLSSQQYSYDKAGRLIQTLDTPQGGSCTTREYKFEGEAGKNSNRTKMITRAPGLGGACDTTSAGTTQSYSYDTADRLLGTGLTYDNLGRITALPAGFAGGKALSTSYFSNDMVAEQSQNGVTNTFQLDGSGRQRQRVQGGGLEGTEVFHYAESSDAPAWTVRGSSWTRSVIGIDGELAAVQDSSSGTALQLTNLHGDVVATAGLSQSETKPTATLEFDEFGNPKQVGSTRFGWLGGKSRRTELSSGVIQMGARGYVPAIGRFLTPDPIIGGSDNAYEYANQDPVNAFDLDGNCSTKKGCKAVAKKAEKKTRKAVARIRSTIRDAREKRATAGASSAMPFGPVPITLPWEEKAEEALGKIENSARGVFSQPCGDTATDLAYAGGAATGAGFLLASGGPVASTVSGMLLSFGAYAGISAAGFYGASKLGIC